MNPKVSVILPCKNEELTIGICIKKIKRVFKENNINGEIIVVDNNSTDRSAIIASKLGAKVIKQQIDGYGAACIKGLKNAKGDYLIIGDADNTYNFLEIPLLLKHLKEGYDLVIGSRIKGKIEKGAMPFHRRHLGNPILSLIFSIFFKKRISDVNSGFRAIKREAFNKLTLQTTGMEFASEMLINAVKNNLKIKETQITYSKRIGKSKLNSMNDGWRHLRFFLIYSPIHLFIIPGLILLSIGLFLLFRSLLNKIHISYVLLGSLFSILGYQVINIGLYSKIYAIISDFEKNDKIIDLIAKYFPLERSLFLGFLLIFSVIILFLTSLPIKAEKLYYSIFLYTFMILGIQTIFSAFFLSSLLIQKRKF